MALSIPDRVVVFDYGEVISRSQSEADKHALVELAGVDAEEFWSVYWRHRDLLDHGRLGVVAYWQRVAGELGRDWDLTTIQQLWVLDFRSWFSVEPGTMRVIEELHAGGTRLALLSNAGFDFGDPFRTAPFASLFERIFVSAELGLLKPEPAIYLHVARELGVDPTRLVFIDNKAVNVDGAVALGVTGHVFTDAARLREFFVRLSQET
ncbi:MAG TPA: HAD family phosphatase [Protaetiibacter sp.]|nr:HAD family phosphatase [Protaetiibacter sp.]